MFKTGFQFQFLTFGIIFTNYQPSQSNSWWNWAKK